MSSLYRQVLLDRYKNLKHNGRIEAANKTIKAHNASCGDNFEITLFEDKGIITDAKFNGNGCMISVVATDVLLDKLVGNSLKEISAYDIETIQQIMGTRLTAGRFKCATVSLESINSST